MSITDQNPDGSLVRSAPISPTPESVSLTEGEATITLDELIKLGIWQGVPLRNGLPWSFTYAGYPVTHENDDCYLITVPAGVLRINRGEVLHVADDSIFVEAL